MTERVLTDEFLGILKSKLHANPYTDEQLHRAAFFMVAPVLYDAGEIGAADVSTAAILTTANLYAASVLADFINAGCVSVSAIYRFMEQAKTDMEEGELGDDGVSAEEDNQD